MAISGFAPVEAKTGRELELAMQRLWLGGQVLPAGARLVVEHVFQTASAQTVEVIYAFPLPRDAALRSFQISGDGFTARSELRDTAEAVAEYEKGLAQGSLSTLARQYGDGVVNLTVGNLRPREIVTVRLEIVAGVESYDDGFRFRFPFTLAPAYHARAHFREAGPGTGEMELPADEFGDVILPPIRRDGAGLHEVGFELAVDAGGALREVSSPSHAVRVEQQAMGRVRVSLATERDVPNRDLVLEARTAESWPEVLAGEGKDGKRHFAAVIPSAVFGERPEGPRRVVVVLDRSGSMEGAPLEQARKAIEACLGALAAEDLFGLVAFDNVVETFEPALAAGSKEKREQARGFLGRIHARGGTDLAAGLLEAARLLGGEGGDVLVLTDGQVAGTETILSQACTAGIRIHCLGIGSASQDRFLALLARETGGVSRFLTARERVDLPAVDLFAAIGRPVASGVRLTGGCVEPDPAGRVYAGTPLLVFGEGPGPLVVTWEGGQREVAIPEGSPDIGEAVRLLRGARLITGFESRCERAPAGSAVVRRLADRVAQRLKTLSAEYGLASREMSLVAVVERAGDRPGDLPKTLIVPVGMPQDTNFTAYFGAAVPAAPAMAMPPSPMRAGVVFSLMRKAVAHDMALDRPKQEEPEDLLLELAAGLEPDGGMPGRTPDQRIVASVIALLAFLSQGHTSRSGAFRSHVNRLITYLTKASQHDAVRAVVELAADVAEGRRKPPSGDWLQRARTPGKFELQSAVAML